MRYGDHEQPDTLSDIFEEMTVVDLKPYLALINNTKPTRKGEIVSGLVAAMLDEAKVRALYDSLDDMSRLAVQEATHDPNGEIDHFIFEAKYGSEPEFGNGTDHCRNRSWNPTLLNLFLPDQFFLPLDLQAILRGFVTEPPPLTIEAFDDLTAISEEFDVEVTMRETTRPALLDVKAVLQLVETGEVRVSATTRRPTKATLSDIVKVLSQGDFYSQDDASEIEAEPDDDLCIQPFAWPLLVQAAGLAEVAGTRLQLTAAGRKALAKPPQDVIRQIWERWQKTTILDEYSRNNNVKGQQAKGKIMTAPSPRRAAIVKALMKCPTQKWIATDQLLRAIRVLGSDFEVAHKEWELYIGDREYGNLEHLPDSWNVLQGLYCLVFLFEYVATLGLLDVAYIPPDGVRENHIGEYDIPCSYLSRYDGALFFRINTFGAWCLGLAETYVPEDVCPLEPLLKVLPNRDVVATARPFPKADALLLERFAVKSSDAVWHLDARKLLGAVEKGETVAELKNFLIARNDGPLPHTVEVFLDDLASKIDQLEDLGAARLIRCKDPIVAQMLAKDPRLGKLCHLTGAHQLVFQAKDETTVRKLLKAMGYVLPPQK